MKKRNKIKFIYQEAFLTKNNLTYRELKIEFNKKYYLFLKEHYHANSSIS